MTINSACFDWLDKQQVLLSALEEAGKEVKPALENKSLFSLKLAAFNCKKLFYRPFTQNTPFSKKLKKKTLKRAGVVGCKLYSTIGFSDLKVPGSFYYRCEEALAKSSKNSLVQAPVVQRLDNAIHWINHYPADSVVCSVNIYPLDSNYPLDSVIQPLSTQGLAYKSRPGSC